MHAMSTVTYWIACTGGLLRAQVEQLPGAIYNFVETLLHKANTKGQSIYAFSRACILQRCDPHISCTSIIDIHQQACILKLRAQEHSAPVNTSPT